MSSMRAWEEAVHTLHDTPHIPSTTHSVMYFVIQHTHNIHHATDEHTKDAPGGEVQEIDHLEYFMYM